MVARHSVLIFVVALAAARADDGSSPPRLKPRPVSYGTAGAATPRWPERIALHDPGSQDALWAQKSFDHRNWKTMSLPAHWEKAGLPDYDGIVWFRRTVEIGEAMARGEATLGLGAIDDMDVTWVNGKRVGGHEQPGAHFAPRNYRLPAGTLTPGKNTIAVRVFDHGSTGGLAQTHGKLQLTGDGKTIPLTGPWHYREGATLAKLLIPGPANSTSIAPRTKPFTGKFALRPHDVVALAGGTSMVQQFGSGHLEAMLTHAASDPVYFRDFAWQADTVYRQQRPRNSGTHLDLLRRMGASVIIANFGQMEALDGATQLPQFLAAYGKLLDEFEKCTPRIVLVSPHRHEKTGNPLLPDLSRRNGDVVAYSEGIRQLARRRGHLYVDLHKLDPSGLTSDSSHLNPEGQRAWARSVMSQLIGREVPGRDGVLEPLRQQIQHKNMLWRQHWRPANWSFLYGNRQHVPSSRDHRPGKPRWFPEEVNAIIPLIEQAEAEIWKVKEGVK
ncbi:MAG: hypothetical protein CMN05_03455 [Roseibacillus sp.]|jgi:hypothetical protein|nr:hypothetical protein [Roseibacillus sp.]MDP7306549.1 hypothetical protein [Roseibacillus sp.]MDP7655795.1 hypothetical protein [Roseibacillus sp.]HJM64111.1 hypothetical protein [Roseibacillus sp.]|tara:strand:+ start:3417 stop:4916 length:1500 start_codon:yes stop_codon:yes gene_type:complete